MRQWPPITENIGGLNCIIYWIQSRSFYSLQSRSIYNLCKNFCKCHHMYNDIPYMNSCMNRCTNNGMFQSNFRCIRFYIP